MMASWQLEIPERVCRHVQLADRVVVMQVPNEHCSPFRTQPPVPQLELRKDLRAGRSSQSGRELLGLAHYIVKSDWRTN